MCNTFFGFRLRWYAGATGERLLRHWQWYLIAGLFVPGLPLIGILGISGQLIVMAVSRGHAVLWYIAFLTGTQAAALLWLWPQREDLTGADFAPYAATLPIPAVARRTVNILLLAVANSPVVVMFGFGLAGHISFGGVEACQSAVLVADLVAVLIAQLAVLEGRPALLIGVALADLLLGIGVAAGGARLADYYYGNWRSNWYALCA